MTKNQIEDAMRLDQLLDDMKRKALRTRNVVRDDKREFAPDKPPARATKANDTIR